MPGRRRRGRNRRRRREGEIARRRGGSETKDGGGEGQAGARGSVARAPRQTDLGVPISGVGSSRKTRKSVRARTSEARRARMGAPTIAADRAAESASMATLQGIAFEARGVVLDWTSSDTRAPRKGFSSPPHPSPRRPEVFFPASVASGQNHPRVRSTASVAFGRVANRADHAQRLSAPVSADSFRDCRDSSSATSTTRATSHAQPCPPPPPLSPGARPSVARPSRPPSGAPRAPSRSLSPKPTRARAAPSWFAPTRSASTW